jgi:hypothetical protein
MFKRKTWKQKSLVIVLLPILLLLVLIVVPLFFLYRVLLYLLVWAMWLPRGKDVLFVSSNSPNRSEYMTTNILPHLSHRAVTLNWSERAQWRRWSLSVLVFRHFGGRREHCALVLIFRPLRPVRRFRFFAAFKAQKKGNPDALETLRRGVMSAL